MLFAYLNEPEDILATREKEWIVRTLNKEKVAANRLFWQMMLTILPLMLDLGSLFSWLELEKTPICGIVHSWLIFTL